MGLLHSLPWLDQRLNVSFDQGRSGGRFIVFALIAHSRDDALSKLTISKCLAISVPYWCDFFIDIILFFEVSC